MQRLKWTFATIVILLVALLLIACQTPVTMPQAPPPKVTAAEAGACEGLPAHGALTTALKSVVVVGDQSVNAGLANDMWATIVNRDGVVCAVTFSGSNRGDQWPGSRAISAQKANTANAFSLPKGSGGTKMLFSPSVEGKKVAKHASLQGEGKDVSS